MGAAAHSLGLETLVEEELLRPANLEIFLRDYLAEAGVLDRYGVELIGATARAIAIAEDRQLFAEAMSRIGLVVASGGTARSFDEALALFEATGPALAALCQVADDLRADAVGGEVGV